MRYFIDCEFHEDGRTIELISIGIVGADGSEYYAEVNLSFEAWQRIEQHEWLMTNVVPFLNRDASVKSRAQVAEEVRAFTSGRGEPEFWAYCGAYDWVVINQLFGPMVEHPNFWPFYCNDIKQLARELGINDRSIPKQTSTQHNALNDARWNRDAWLWLMAERANQDTGLLDLCEAIYKTKRSGKGDLLGLIDEIGGYLK